MPERTNHGRRRNFQRMPRWISSCDYRLINRAEKSLLAYLYRFEGDNCRLRSSALTKKFYVSHTTIRRRLRRLRDQGLITIENPGTWRRLIHTTFTGWYPKKQLTA